MGQKEEGAGGDAWGFLVGPRQQGLLYLFSGMGIRGRSAQGEGRKEVVF